MSRIRYALIAVSVIAFAFVLPAGKSSADSNAINFETGYAPGSIYGQSGWTGSGCEVIDQAVVNNAAFPAAPASFGTQSFRMSSAVVSGCFVDSFTPGLANEAGESTAQNNGLSGGVRQSEFYGQWTFASATGGLQPGLKVQVSPDRGDGARMSYVRMRHNGPTDPFPGAMDLSFVDVQGTDPPNSAPCLSCANFVETSLGTYDPTVPHSVGMLMDFYEGPSNDVVKVYVDGVLKHTGGSWEDYFTMDTESSPTPPRVSRTVDSLLIRASGSPAPSTSGNGFLFDDISYSSESVASTMKADPAIVVNVNPLVVKIFDLTARLTTIDGHPLAGKNIKFNADATKLCNANTNADGVATCNATASALNIILNHGYGATFTGDSTNGPAYAHGKLVRVLTVTLP